MIIVFADQAGAVESMRQAADWVQRNLVGFFTGPPAVMSESVWLQWRRRCNVWHHSGVATTDIGR